VQVSDQNVTMVVRQKTHILAPLGRIPGPTSINFFMWLHTVASHLYSRFHPDAFRLWEVITKKIPHRPPNWIQYRLYEPMINSNNHNCSKYSDTKKYKFFVSHVCKFILWSLKCQVLRCKSRVLKVKSQVATHVQLLRGHSHYYNWKCMA